MLFIYLEECLQTTPISNCVAKQASFFTLLLPDEKKNPLLHQLEMLCSIEDKVDTASDSEAVCSG